MTSSDVTLCESELLNLDITLKQVEAALLSSESNEPQQTEELITLKAELLELRQLTQDRLIDLKKSELLSMLDNVGEVSNDETQTTDSNQLSNNDLPCREYLPDSEDLYNDEVMNLEDPARIVTENLNTLKGSRCSIPHWTANGVFHYQNSVIYDVTETAEGQDEVHVLLCNPTRSSEVPCSRWLAGENCSNCGHSHGFPVVLAQLHDYIEPDFSRLTEGSLCLALFSNESVWRHCQVVSSDLANQQCYVRLTRREDSTAFCVQLDKVLPLIYERGTMKTLDEDDAQESDNDRVNALGSESSSFGAWEQHTRGLGSRLLQQMGFKPGQGLGIRGQGRAIPVPIEVLPPGRSLDTVLRLRLKNKGLPSAPKVNKPSTSSNAAPAVFDFINKKLDAPKTTSRTTSVCERSLDKRSDKSLAVQAYETDREITKAELNIDRLRSSLDRCCKSGPAAEKIKKQISEAESYLLQLKTSIRTLEKHRNQRSSKKKLTVF